MMFSVFCDFLRNLLSSGYGEKEIVWKVLLVVVLYFVRLFIFFLCDIWVLIILFCFFEMLCCEFCCMNFVNYKLKFGNIILLMFISVYWLFVCGN